MKSNYNYSIDMKVLYSFNIYLIVRGVDKYVTGHFLYGWWEPFIIYLLPLPSVAEIQLKSFGIDFCKQ